MIAKDWNEAKAQVDTWKADGLKVVFTNGCFDILHRGHVEYLADTKDCGDRLVLALNSDRSVRELKGDSRPIQNEDDRAAILDALSSIDMVVVFDEDTPADIVKMLIPDVLAKGGDYTPDTIVGADTVIENGGEVKVIPFRPGQSTSSIVEKIIKL
ncbi:MAG: D-glycero-beta-D-manno-heptose 1-phosphate adenylyltransferase [Candidatus Marinimicrobia bacterium]|jgi:D-beta-D-heptose 7-phosphate kinase/D-beta-D-heptose 1-phosphate adenosyltransferase|nr:D-glycero-beta-D-manno-heptose 1-phosphate adenylyltransferase [Candidatus Neomarinimicrobiota bacterium]MBT3840150.1 D-glycero-beta-D-manno-heptose 1-phosphate adenylyltransferase [Candidatus Neomarinimicrobiota bacterium]MBT3999144.1 D-glycero-beta-D-manno-heptose 1-phosphate adenylyltransferase [Candidatus Neomarinimicrobiota bacterium]MBT4282580.1 D-glycero-beta-D-manno-heptose 1-phosphate adenylyltransferase [Candidatus Neomarinimicrobiota bacterium]MBT4579676.1 D-glycero-beta-D-manno-h